MKAVRKPLVAFGLVVTVALVVAAAASAHAIMSPAVVKADNTLQQFTLSVPTEEANAITTKIELTVPSVVRDRLVRAAARTLEDGHQVDGIR